MSDAPESQDEKALAAVTGAGAVMPAWITEGSAGTDHIEDKDTQLPRLALAQKTSNQIDEDDPLHIEGLEFGHIFNDLTEHLSLIHI